MRGTYLCTCGALLGFLLSSAQFCSVLLSSAQFCSALGAHISTQKCRRAIFDDSFVNSGLRPIDYSTPKNTDLIFVVFRYPPSVDIDHNSRIYDHNATAQIVSMNIATSPIRVSLNIEVGKFILCFILSLEEIKLLFPPMTST